MTISFLDPQQTACGKAQSLNCYPGVGTGVGTLVQKGDGSRDARAESALHTSTVVKIHAYATISQIRCPRDIAPCHGPRYRTKRDIH
jgi:hypothetical protein